MTSYRRWRGCWSRRIAAPLLRRRRRTVGRFLAVVTSFTRASATALDPRPALHARRDVDRALRLLSEPKRVTLLMAEVEGLTCPEIAAALRVPLGTVYTRLHAARRELRRALEGGES
jgi:RNA polymerase sigma-70 factor (ECF subfamily)